MVVDFTIRPARSDFRHFPEVVFAPEREQLCVFKTGLCPNLGDVIIAWDNAFFVLEVGWVVNTVHSDYGDFMSKTIYLCGVPCSGKTTLIDLLVSQLGCIGVPEFLAATPEDFWALSSSSTTEHVQRVIRWCYNQVLLKERMIRQHKRSLVACDRSPLDLLVYAKTLSAEVTFWLHKRMQRVIWRNGIVVLLMPPPRTELVARLCARDGLTVEQAEHIIVGLITPLSKSFDYIYDRVGVYRVHTSGRDAHDIAREISELDTPTNINLLLSNHRSYFYNSIASQS